MSAPLKTRSVGWLAATLLAAGGALLPAARAVEAPAYYEPALGAVVVPYPDHLPALATHALDKPPRIAIDFPAGLHLARAIGGEVAGHPLLASWAMAPHPGGLVRLTLTFRREAGVALQDDAEHHRLVVLVLPEGRASASPAPTPTPGVKATATPTPTPTPTPAPSRDPLPFVSFLPVVPVGPSPSPTPTPEDWTLPLPSPRSFLEPSPSPSPSPSPGETPTPAAPSERAAGEAARVRADIYLMDYRESYPRGGVDTQVGYVRMQGLEAEGHWPASWAELLRFDAGSYAFQDLNLPTSAHLRDNYRGEAAVFYRLDWGALGVDFGPGYMLRYESATHTGAPPSPNYAFSSVRIVHGPELALRAHWQIGWGFGLTADAAVMPYLFSAIDGDLPSLPTLWGYRAEAGIEQELGPFALGLMVRERALFGDGYEEGFLGPGLWLGVRAGY